MPSFDKVFFVTCNKRSILAVLLAVLAGSEAGTLHAQVTAAQHLQRAHSFLTQKQPAQAIPEFRAVLETDPNNADAVGNLGVLLYFSGDYSGAAPLLTRTVAAQPIPRLQALLGLAQRRSGQADAARTTLQAAFPALEQEKQAIYREVGLELIEMDTAAGDLPAAATVVAQLKATLPEDPGVLYAAYRINTDLANEAMLELSVAAPKSAQMHQAMAHELQRKRDIKGAVANYRQALAADPALPGAHYEFAEALRLSDESALKAEAEQQYQLALKANPSDAHSMTRLGDFAAARGDHAGAIALYRQALHLLPADTDAGIGLAHELVETDQLAEALPLLQSMEKADPTDVLVHFRLAALYRRMHRPDDTRREVADYEKYKAIKEKLRALYQEMRLDAPGTSPENP